MRRECFGKFNDGKTATPKDVRLVLDPPVLDIRDDGDVRIEAWPLKDIRIVGEIFENAPIRLKRGDHGQSRLQFENPVFFSALTDTIPHIAKNPNLRWRSIVVSTVCLIVVFAGSFLALPHVTRVAAHWVPVSWETDIGSEALDQILSFFGSEAAFCNGGRGQAVLDKLSGRLLGQIDTPYEIKIRVADIEHVNAFAMLGGHVVLFNGLLKDAQSADEVAGVLAHEIGHLTERHPTQGIIRATGLSILFEIFFGDSSAIAGLAQTMLTLSYGRDAEREADEVAVKLLHGADISATGMANFFDRLSEKEGQGGPLSLLSTHPESKERAATVRSRNLSGRAAMSEAEWQALKTICD